MNHVTTIPHVDFLETWHTVSRRLAILLSGNTANDQLEDLAHIKLCVDSLPLATNEDGLAQNRIRNARRYYQGREVGAARYELRLLMCSLRRTFADQVGAEPRRRLRRTRVA